MSAFNYYKLEINTYTCNNMLKNDRRLHVYMQCVKNQSGNIGTYTIDGYGEFIPLDEGLYCSACGCHCSFNLKLYLQDISKLY